MNYEIKTKIVIHAEVSKVWQVLTNFAAYPSWNPFIRSLEGSVSEGTKITAKIAPPGSSSMTFKPKVLVFQKNTEFRWKGKLLITGLFDGEHYFILHDLKDGTTLLEHGEKFSGILVPIFKMQLESKTLKGFEQMNVALKDLVEL